MHTCYSISSSDIVFEEFGGEMVILNLGSGKYFGLNASGAMSWDAISKGATVARLTPETAKQTQLAVFIERLLEFGLITPADVDSGYAPSSFNLNAAPEIEVYDDLADLIIADPIHDVDADSGWPVRPDNGKLS